MDPDTECNNACPSDFFKRQNCFVALLEISRHIYGRACFVDFLTFLLRGLAKAQLAGRQKRVTTTSCCCCAGYPLSKFSSSATTILVVVLDTSLSKEVNLY